MCERRGSCESSEGVYGRRESMTTNIQKTNEVMSSGGSQGSIHRSKYRGEKKGDTLYTGCFVRKEYILLT